MNCRVERPPRGSSLSCQDQNINLAATFLASALRLRPWSFGPVLVNPGQVPRDKGLRTGVAALVLYPVPVRYRTGAAKYRVGFLLGQDSAAL